MKFAGRLQRAAQREARKQNDIVLVWQEPVEGETADPTTGSIATIDKTCTIHALVHSVNPSNSGFRMHAEMQTGDKIVDFPIGLARITYAGDTDFSVGDIVSDVDLKKANSKLGSSEAPAVGEEVLIGSLKNLSVIIDGQTWVQASAGNNPVQAWDARVNRRQVCQSFHFKLAT